MGLRQDNGAATVRERSVPVKSPVLPPASGLPKGIKTPGFSTERCRDCRPINDRELSQPNTGPLRAVRSTGRGFRRERYRETEKGKRYLTRRHFSVPTQLD